MNSGKMDKYLFSHPMERVPNDKENSSTKKGGTLIIPQQSICKCMGLQRPTYGAHDFDV